MRSNVQHSGEREDAAVASAQLAAAYAQASVGLAVLDGELRVRAANDVLGEVSGRTPAELAGAKLGRALPGVGGDVEARLREVLETGRPVDGLPLAQDGAEPRHWVLAAARLGDEPALGLTLVEVSEHVGSASALRDQRDLYDTLLRAQADLGEALVLLEGGRVIYVNAVAEALAGRPAAELYALGSILELFPPEQREGIAEQYRAVGRDRDGAPRFLADLVLPDGSRPSLEVAAKQLDEAGRTRLLLTARDVSERLARDREREKLLAAERSARTDAAEATRRAQTLAEIGEALDNSMNLRMTLPGAAQVICRQGVPLAGLYVCDPTGTTVRRMAIAQAAGEDALALPVTENTFDLRSANPFATVARTGEPFSARHMTPATLAALRDGDRPDPVPFSRQPGSMVALPLIARGHTVGVLALAWWEPDRELAPDELAWWRQVGRRLALGIDNALLYGERAHIAATLQAGLLPPRLPEIPGVQAAARYFPAGEAAEVGGDFYDLFATEDGAWTVVVGDVCGKGPEAAAATAMVRYTLRAACVRPGGTPKRAFAALNAAMLAEEVPERFVTVVAARVQLTDGRARLELAAGGHPAPLVVRADGTVEAVDVSGSVLGVVDDVDWEPTSVELSCGDRVVLYTDGVSEARRSEPLEAAELAVLLNARPAAQLGFTAGDLADALRWLAEERAGGPLRDDVAILALALR